MRNNNNNNVCRLCLKLVRSANLAYINEVMRERLRLLLIKLDLDVSDHPLVCRTCSRLLDEIYIFKSKCLYTDDIVSTHIKTNSVVSLRDILMEMENTRDIHISEDEVVCRLCIKIPLNDSYIALGETGEGISFITDTIQVHLPEIDLSITEKPIICETCRVCLKNFESFATNSMAVEEKIKLYCDSQKISGPVDLACVLRFMEEKALDLQNRLDKDLTIKQEDDSVMVKVEKVQDAEDYIILEDNLAGSSSPSELCLKNEEIEIKSENDEMSEEMGDSVPWEAPNNSVKNASLKRKGEIRKSLSKGRKYLSSDDHMATHMERNKTFGCRECTFKTKRKYNLERHMVRHKDESEEGEQMRDNREFETRNKGNIIRHMVTHGDTRVKGKFKCDQCLFEADYESKLRRHNVIHKDKSEVQMHSCENCEFESRHKSSLIHHMVIHRDPRRDRKFKCDQCPFETDFKSHLRVHNLRHKDKSEVEMHKCANCEFETRYKSSMVKHMLTHRDSRAERKYKCDQCPYETDNKSYLGSHNVIHKDKSEVEMHKCENCDFETKRKRNLITHMMKHRDPRAERRFKCGKCRFETDFKFSLSHHNLIHKDKSEVEMFKCANCEYETKRKRNLITHMIKHRDPRAKRKFKCDLCPYETDFMVFLGQHNLVHKDKSEVEMHKCVNCEYETKRKRNLIEHMVKHRDPGAREFKCDECPYETDHKYFLQRHNRRRHKNKT